MIAVTVFTFSLFLLVIIPMNEGHPYRHGSSRDSLFFGYLVPSSGWWGWNSSKSRSSKAALKSNDPNLTRGFKNMLSGGFRREKFGATLMAWQQLLKLWILLLFNWNQEIERKQKLCSFWILISFHWVEVSKPSYLHFFNIKCVRKRWFVWKGGTLLTKSWVEKQQNRRISWG